MKWFAKYWILKKKFDLLLEEYNELKRYVDKSFWGDSFE